MIQIYKSDSDNVPVDQVVNFINLHINNLDLLTKSDNSDYKENYYKIVGHLDKMVHEYSLIEVFQANQQYSGNLVVRYIKKMVAKCVTWYLKDCIHRQTEFNRHNLNVINIQQAIIQTLIEENSKKE